MDSVIKPRTGVKELKGPPPDPLNTKKSFITIDKPGVTDPASVPKDFSVRSVFPTLRPAGLNDLPSLTKEYYLFHHGIWFTWGGLPVDPLLEFHLRDGESNKCVSLVPLKERILYGVARNKSEIPAEFGLFAVPRDRMRDLLFWMDGVTIANNGVFQWGAARQHLPLDARKTDFDDRHDTEYLAFYGMKSAKDIYGWARYLNGFCVLRQDTQLPEEQRQQQLIIRPDA